MESSLIQEMQVSVFVRPEGDELEAQPAKHALERVS
jgi:hypothetical protein